MSNDVGDSGVKTPKTGVAAVRCAAAENGHAAVAPMKVIMSRRLIGSPFAPGAHPTTA